MVITPHAVYGAYLTQDVRFSFISGVMSHYALDKIPHYDYDLNGKYGKLFLALDATLALYLLKDQPAKSWIGALGAIAPDVLAVGLQKGVIPKHALLQKAQDYHQSNHTKLRPNLLVGGLIQIIFLLSVLYRRKKR